MFEGIKIELYFDEHPPPHFHARYREHVAQIGIEGLQLRKGFLPPAQLRKVRAWAETRYHQLLAAWELCESGIPPDRIL